MKYAFLACTLMLTYGCSTKNHFFLRDPLGELVGPISLKTGTRVATDYWEYRVDDPRPTELETIARMRTTVLPYISFSNTPLSEVAHTLYSHQCGLVGNKPVPVYFVPIAPTSHTNEVGVGGIFDDPFSSAASGATVRKTHPTSVTYRARNISLWQAVKHLRYLTGLEHIDIRDGTVSLRPVLTVDSLPEAAPVADPVAPGVAQQFQKKIDSVARMLADLHTPDHLSLGKSDARKFADEFDAMSFFRLFTNISMQEGYVLDYVQTQWALGCSPELYARKRETQPYVRPWQLHERKCILKSNAVAQVTAEYERWRKAVLSGMQHEEAENAMMHLCRQVTELTVGGNADECLSHIVIPDKPIAYLECIALHLLGEQFYLGWHALQNETQIVCTRDALKRLLQTPAISQRLDDSDRSVLSSIDPTPSFCRLGDDVYVSIVTFSKRWGLSRRRYTISSEFPHRMTIGVVDNLWF